MHAESLRFLYREYKNCMKNEFSEYFGKDDEYKSYSDKCYNQKLDIQRYAEHQLNKLYFQMPEREEKEVLNKYERRFNLFSVYGWTGSQIKNYFLNYDRSQEEHDPWVNHIMSGETRENYGLPDFPETLEMEETRLPIVLTQVIQKHQKKDFIDSYKWTGKASEQWNRIFSRGISKEIPSFK